ncbi:MAG TPA: hypothetical protein VL069_08500, partial [Opitutus sp.]|nr:hypothetical protein [Opitutus sp.]
MNLARIDLTAETPHGQGTIKPSNPILFTEGNEENEESHDHLPLFVLFVRFCSIPSTAWNICPSLVRRISLVAMLTLA